MLIAGLALLATSIVLVWLCLPSKSGEIKSFLRRRSRSEMAAGVATACIAASIIMTIAGEPMGLVCAINLNLKEDMPNLVAETPYWIRKAM